MLQIKQTYWQLSFIVSNLCIRKSNSAQYYNLILRYQSFIRMNLFTKLINTLLVRINHQYGVVEHAVWPLQIIWHRPKYPFQTIWFSFSLRFWSMFPSLGFSWLPREWSHYHPLEDSFPEQTLSTPRKENVLHFHFPWWSKRRSIPDHYHRGHACSSNGLLGKVMDQECWQE